MITLVSNSARFCVVIIFVLLPSGDLVKAQERPESHSDNWDLSVWFTTATGEENRNSFTEAQILTAGFFLGRMLTGEIGSGWRRGRFEYGVDLMPLFIQVRPERFYGGGFEPVVLRWNSSRHKKSVSPYIELAGGAVRTNSNFPPGDTSAFNFTARGGGGVQISARNRQSLDIGCRWWHISNANLGVRNPEFNGIQMSIGYHWHK